MNKKAKEVDMTHGPLAGKIVMFAIPLAVSAMLQQLFNAADLAVVGRFTNPQCMAAVGSNGSIVGLMVNLFTGLSVGANVLIANLIGAGRREKISEAVHTVILLALLSGVFLTFVGMTIAYPMLRLMGSPSDVIDLAAVYLRIYFCGMPAIMVYNFGSAILRSKGDSRRPFISLTLAGVINVILNLIFVVVFHLHVIGVALATVISNCVSGGLILYYLMHEDDETHVDLRSLKMVPEHLSSMIRIGLPAGIQGMVFSLSNVFIQSGVNSFGANCVAGISAAVNFDFISYCLMNGFTQAAVTFMSQNYGAGEKERCHRVWKTCIGIGIGADVIVVGVVWLLRNILIQIFTTDPEVIRFAMVRFNYAFCVHFIVGTYEITAGALRGLGRSAVPAAISIIGTCAFRLLYVLLIFPRFNTPEALILVYPLSWVITGTAMIIAYFIVKKKALSGTATA